MKIFINMYPAYIAKGVMISLDAILSFCSFFFDLGPKEFTYLSQGKIDQEGGISFHYLYILCI